MNENESPKEPNKFSYYVVARWNLPGTNLGRYVAREVLVDAPFTETAQIERIALSMAETIPVQVRGQDNAMLVGNDIPKPVCVIITLHELKAWYDPRPLTELLTARRKDS